MFRGRTDGNIHEPFPPPESLGNKHIIAQCHKMSLFLGQRDMYTRSDGITGKGDKCLPGELREGSTEEKSGMRSYITPCLVLIKLIT